MNSCDPPENSFQPLAEARIAPDAPVAQAARPSFWRRLFGDNRIGTRLIVLIIVFSSLITLLLTVVQLALDYRQQRQDLDLVLDTASVHVPNIAGSVWALDRVQTELALQALEQMPNIDQASVIMTQPPRRWSVGKQESPAHSLTRSFELKYEVQGRHEVIGTLEVVANLDNIYWSVARHAAVMLLSNGIKTFLVAIFMYFVFRRIVTERLASLGRKVDAQTRQFIHRGTAPVAGTGDHPGDELDLLEHDFDQMSERIRGLVNELRRSNADLLQENAERRRAQEALREQQIHLEDLVEARTGELLQQKEQLADALSEIERIVENASLGVTKITLCPDGRRIIISANHAFEQILGCGSGELNGLDVRQFFADGEACGRVGAAYDRILRRGESYCGEHNYRRRDGGTVMCYVVGAAIDPNNLDKGAIWLVEDITVRKQAQLHLAKAKETAEAALAERTHANAELSKTLLMLRETQEELVRRQKLAALGALVAGIAHELNTPIGNGLMGASTLSDLTVDIRRKLDDGLRRSTLKEYFDAVGHCSGIVTRNLERAAELVSSFRQVAVDQTSSQYREFMLAELVAEMLTLLQPTLRKTPFEVDSRIDPGIRMTSYPGPLGQVLNNLINNALIHGFEERAEGHVAIVARQVDAEWVEITVSDDGVGIAEGHIERIFDPFFTTRLGQGGSGLGLSIVHNVVTAMLGGKITVESQVGQGTTFQLLLPNVAPEHDLEAVQLASGWSL